MAKNNQRNQHVAKQSSRDSRINEQITVDEVRLVMEDGEQKGIVKLDFALQLAKDLELDLVEVSPNAVPPACKILNYSKYKFKQEKINRTQQKNNKQHKLKEVRMHPKIDIHDLTFKSKHIQGFLAHGSKVKITVRFKGREMAHTDRGFMILEQIMGLLEEGSFAVESRPKLEGNQMFTLISPKKVSKSDK